MTFITSVTLQGGPVKNDPESYFAARIGVKNCFDDQNDVIGLCSQSVTHHAHEYVPHKAVAEVAKRANYRRLVAVNHGSKGKSTDESKSGCRQP